jgi:hypothetical protein
MYTVLKNYHHLNLPHGYTTIPSLVGVMGASGLMLGV